MKSSHDRIHAEIKAIVFDLDGTLVDAYPGIHQSLNETLRALGLPEVDLYTLKRRVGRGVINLIQQSVPPEKVKAALEMFRASYDLTHLSGTHVLPYTRETLQILREKRIGLGVASNKPAEFTQNILRHFGLDRYFAVCAGPDVTIRAKPHPSMMEFVLKNLGVTANETLYVGDMTLDAETARNAGVQLALIPTGGHSREELVECDPDYLLDRLTDVVGIIDSEVRGG